MGYQRGRKLRYHLFSEVGQGERVSTSISYHQTGQRTYNPDKQHSSNLFATPKTLSSQEGSFGVQSCNKMLNFASKRYIFCLGKLVY